MSAGQVVASAVERFAIAAIRKRAGEAVFARGLDYRNDVEIIALGSTGVTAKVRGSDVYRTELRGADGAVDGSCTCPAFSNWGFCKHLVATALVANDAPEDVPDAAIAEAARLREHLLGKSRDALADMILKLAAADPQLMRALRLAAAAEMADDAELVAELEAAVTEATETGDYLEYRQVRAWAETLEGLLERIANIVELGRAAVVLPVLDHLFARLVEAQESLDDSAGHAGGVYCRACEIHLAACRAAKPDPVALARQLFEREVEDADAEGFAGASDTYADVLGPSGLAEYRRLAEAAWAKGKPLKGGDRASADEFYGARFQIGEILERFAERDGGVDRLIAIRARSLSSGHAYLGLAELCLRHGRDAEALSWAEEGLWTFDDTPDERLVIFAADLYRRVGRPADAGKVLWDAFARAPSAALYWQLKAMAGEDRAAATGVRDRALDQLRSATAKLALDRSWAERQLLLRLLTSEGLFDAAWRVATAGPCAEEAVTALATASEASHPGEVVRAYIARVERHVGNGGNPGYAEACRLLARIGVIRDRTGEGALHATYLADLKIRHKMKRNFMKLLQA